MTTAATSLLGLALPVTGELSGTWGSVVNDSITSLLDNAIAGTTTLSTDADVTLTTTTLASNQARQAIILWTASGTVTRYITAPAQSKIYTVINKTGSTQSIVIRGVGPTTGVTVPAGRALQVAWNGVDFVDVSDSFAANGTANGVVYLNSSKVPTAGSALVFDGTNLGLGVTPSAIDLGKMIEVGQVGCNIWTPAVRNIVLNSNAYYNGGNKYATTGAAGSYQIANGVHYWYNAASGTAGNTITFTQAMTLGADGTLGVGVTNAVSADGTLVAAGSVGTGQGAANTVAQINIWETTSGNKAGLWFGAMTNQNTGVIGSRTGSGNIAFQTYNGGWAERMRLTYDGNLGLGVTPSAVASSDRVLQVRNFLFDDNSNGYGILRYNNYYNGTNDVYLNTGTVSAFQMAGNAFRWYQAASGTAGTAITFTQAMTLDASGNLSVGTTSVVTAGSGYQAYTINGANGSNIALNGGGSNIGLIYAATGNSNLYIGNQTAGGAVIFNAGSGSERARIDSSGNFFIGTTNIGYSRKLGVTSSGDAAMIQTTGSATSTPCEFWNTATSGDNRFTFFYTEGTPTARGSIDYNRAGGLTRYNTTSDQRLKENIVDAPSAMSLINGIKIRSFDWKETGFHVDHGVIAQELQQVVPEAVSVGDDNEDESVKKPWGVDTSVLVPALVKALQEMKAIIDDQAARIAALEAK